MPFLRSRARKVGDGQIFHEDITLGILNQRDQPHHGSPMYPSSTSTTTSRNPRMTLKGLRSPSGEKVRNFGSKKCGTFIRRGSRCSVFFSSAHLPPAGRIEAVLFFHESFICEVLTGCTDVGGACTAGHMHCFARPVQSTSKPDLRCVL